MTPHLDSKRLPLNEPTIVFSYSGVNKGIFGKGEYVSLIDIQEPCTREDCTDQDEYLTFDGQVFYKKQASHE